MLIAKRRLVARSAAPKWTGPDGLGAETSTRTGPPTFLDRGLRLSAGWQGEGVHISWRGTSSWGR